jgi:DNA repair protein RadC
MYNYTLVKNKISNKEVFITTSKDLDSFIRPIFNEIDSTEEFYIILLNVKNMVVGYRCIGKGTASACLVDTSIIPLLISEHRSCSVAICHNHPSGNLNPSEKDKIVTKNIESICDMLNARFLDHLILTEDSCFSFKNNGI